MWLLATLLAGSFACNEFCATSCGILNGPRSCYLSCGCDYAPVTVPVLGALKSQVTELQTLLVKDSECAISSFQACASIKCPHKSRQCLAQSKCEVLTDFQYIVENIPSHLWLAVEPPILTNYQIQEQNSYKFDNFVVCQDDCFSDAGLNFETSSENYYDHVSGCVEIMCSSKLNLKKNIQAPDLIVGQIVEESSEVDAQPLTSNTCQANCYLACIVNGLEAPGCYDNCVPYCPTSGLQESNLQALVTNCGQVCFQQCLTSAGISYTCYNPCMLNCQNLSYGKKLKSILENTEPKTSKLQSSSNNCYNACKADKDVIGCFNSCSQRSAPDEIVEEIVMIDEKPSESINHMLRDSKDERSCYNKCFINGKFNSECNSLCLSSASQPKSENPEKVSDKTACRRSCYVDYYIKQGLSLHLYNECLSSCQAKIQQTPDKEIPKEDSSVIPETQAGTNSHWKCYHKSFINNSFSQAVYEQCIASEVSEEIIPQPRTHILSRTMRKRPVLASY